MRFVSRRRSFGRSGDLAGHPPEHVLRLFQGEVRVLGVCEGFVGRMVHGVTRLLSAGSVFQPARLAIFVEYFTNRGALHRGRRRPVPSLTVLHGPLRLSSAGFVS